MSWRAFEWLTGDRIDDPKVVALGHEVAEPLPVPATAIWSASDGLVNGAICQEPGCRNIEVRSSHMGVQLRPEVLLADREDIGRGIGFFLAARLREGSGVGSRYPQGIVCGSRAPTPSPVTSHTGSISAPA